MGGSFRLKLHVCVIVDYVVTRISYLVIENLRENEKVRKAYSNTFWRA